MKVILSIKPRFADKIFDGTKTFEFRRSIFKQPIKTVLVYSSSPVQRVIGEFKIKHIHKFPLDELWTKTALTSGIEKEYFTSYFNGKDFGYAIEVDSFTLYDKPLKLKEKFGVHPPQSFVYLKV